MSWYSHYKPKPLNKLSSSKEGWPKKAARPAVTKSMQPFSRDCPLGLGPMKGRKGSGICNRRRELLSQYSCVYPTSTNCSREPEFISWISTRENNCS